MKRFVVVLLVAGGLTGCGTEYVEQSDAGVPQDAQAQDDAEPQCGPDVYPCPPYGLGSGSIITNITWNGWIDDNGDGDLTNDDYHVWGLDYFYQLGLAGEANWLVLNGSAGWCTYCRQENTMLPAIAAEYAPSKIAFAEFVFQDNAGDPATKDFVLGWIAGYDLPFPVGVDATFKMGLYFDSGASPANLFISLRDQLFDGAPVKAMQIVQINTGFAIDEFRAGLNDLRDKTQ